MLKEESSNEELLRVAEAGESIESGVDAVEKMTAPASFGGFWAAQNRKSILHLFFMNFNIKPGWWFGTFFIFHNIWDNQIILPID